MVQGEKETSLMSHGGMNGRTSDPTARKAGFESIKRLDMDKKESRNSTYGSWGPVFKDKKTFAQMHF